MATHTPGPWEYGGVAGITTTFDREVNIYPPDASLTGGYQYSGPIAVVAVGEDAGGEANARLVAAAPDLLAACEAVIEAVGNPHSLTLLANLHGPGGLAECIMRLLQPAVAMAKGE